MARSVPASTLLAIDITGVTPLPPTKATTGRGAGSRQKTPAGLVTSSSSPSCTWSWNQFDTRPPGTRLTVTLRWASVSGALDME